MRIYVIIIFFILSSCNREEDQIMLNPPGKINHIITSWENIYTSDNYYTKTNFLYNQKEQLVKKVEEYNNEIIKEWNFYYFENGLMKKKEIQDYSEPPAKSIHHYEYDDENILIKEITDYQGVKYYSYNQYNLLWNIKYYPIEGTGLYDILYEYDSIDGKLKFETMFLQQLSDTKQEIYTKYEYNYYDDNLLKNKTLLGGNQSEPLPRIEIEYIYEKQLLKKEIHYKVDQHLVYRLDKTIEYFYN